MTTTTYNDTELESLMILAAIPYLGPIKARLLFEYFGSAAGALAADPSELRHLPGFGPKLLDSWNLRHTLRPSLDRNWGLITHHKAQIIPFYAQNYPKRLLEIADHPLLLYIKGDLSPKDHHAIAIIGTRQASIYGLEMAQQLARDLATQGITVVSGLARGIDSAAHEGALKTGRTLAVIGSGLANLYPPENRQLAEQIATQGGVLTEFPMETPPDRLNFPQRNRIVAAMTMGSLLIEAPVRSGAMLTMERARNYKRNLFALPGRADQESFKGNHMLIKTGSAHLVENARDVLSAYEELFTWIPPKTAVSTGIPLDKEELQLLEQMSGEEISLEELQRKSGLPATRVTILLMSLVLKKIIKEFPGKFYKKVR